MAPLDEDAVRVPTKDKAKAAEVASTGEAEAAEAL